MSAKHRFAGSDAAAYSKSNNLQVSPVVISTVLDSPKPISKHLSLTQRLCRSHCCRSADARRRGRRILVDHQMPRRAAEKLSVEYVRAIKQGKTLGLLVQREGREQVEKRVIEKAQSDPIFAWDLTRRTRETLEKFLDVKIPDVVAVDVIVESARSFALVIPMNTGTTAHQRR